VHLQASWSAGLFAISTVFDPGVQGAGITGTQGAGVGTPSAALVAAATAGLDWVVHRPKVGMFFIGTLSKIVAAGGPAMVLFSGVTTKAHGARPKLQVIIAPAVTSFGIKQFSGVGSRHGRQKLCVRLSRWASEYQGKPGRLKSGACSDTLRRCLTMPPSSVCMIARERTLDEHSN